MVAGEAAKQMSFEEFARDLDAVFAHMADDGKAVVVERGGKTYRIQPEDPFAGYDPEPAKAALLDLMRMFAEIDGKAFVAEMKAARGQDSRGRPASS